MFHKAPSCSVKESVTFLMLVLSVLLTLTHPFKVTCQADVAKIKDILGEMEVDSLVLTYVPWSIKIVFI